MPLTPETQPTSVLFRTERSPKDHQVTAVFPTEPGSTLDPYLTACYAHVGQHGSCSLDWYRSTRPAKPEEYADLKAELERIGYRLKVYRRLTRGHRDLFRQASK